MQQFIEVAAFRQRLSEHAFTRERDAQFELLDALMFSRGIRSYPELSMSAAFRRQWNNAYKAIERGRQDVSWLEQYVIRQVPAAWLVILPLDANAWPHPQARAPADRQYVYRPTAAVPNMSHRSRIRVQCIAPDAKDTEPRMGKPLTFRKLLAPVQQALDRLPEHRSGQNILYSLTEAGLSAFAVFYMQSPSFLAHQRDMQRRRERNNV